MVTTPFRITPSLGPDLWQRETQYHWDMIGDRAGTGDASYQPGSVVIGNDGHEYVHVKATGAIAANGTFGVNETTWATGAGTTHTTSRAVLAGQWFHARKVAL